VIGSGWDVQRVGEGETSAKACGLKAEECVERCRGRRAVRETNEARGIVRAGHAVAARSKLFGDGAMADDHTGDGGRVVCADEYAAWDHGRIPGSPIGSVRRQAVGRNS
jgi:hypothetical protein